MQEFCRSFAGTFLAIKQKNKRIITRKSEKGQEMQELFVNILGLI